jgi:hypothetical protein
MEHYAVLSTFAERSPASVLQCLHAESSVSGLVSYRKYGVLRTVHTVRMEEYLPASITICGRNTPYGVQWHVMAHWPCRVRPCPHTVGKNGGTPHVGHPMSPAEGSSHILRR